MTSPNNDHDDAPNRLSRMAADRRRVLKQLARSANLSHQWAAASAGAAVAHVVDAQASTCDEVYFVEAVGVERLKIGVSRDVPARLAQLAASFPGPLVLLGTIRGGRAREACLHQRLAVFRIGGEWFHLTPGVRAVVMALIADQPQRAGPPDIAG